LRFVNYLAEDGTLRAEARERLATGVDFRRSVG
jgi:hypothetical protein